MSIAQLAEQANIGLKRAYRVLEALKQAEYIQLRCCHRIDQQGEIIPQRAIKRVSSLFFQHLGIGQEKLYQCLRYARKQAEKASYAFKKIHYQQRKQSTLFLNQYDRVSQKTLQYQRKLLAEKNIQHHSTQQNQHRAGQSSAIKPLSTYYAFLSPPITQ